MTIDELRAWKAHKITQQLFEYLELNNSEVEKQMFEGQCKEPYAYGLTIGRKKVIESILTDWWAETQLEE